MTSFLPKITLLFLITFIPLLAFSQYNTKETLVGPMNSSFVVPCGVTEIQVKAWAGGGGGGGTPTIGGGCGGGGGAYCSSIYTVLPGQTFPYMIGDAGLGGSPNNSGGVGGTTTFNGMTATGGTGGDPYGGDAGLGGSASGGTINLNGFPGYIGSDTTGGAGGHNGLSVGAGKENDVPNTIGTFGFIGGGGGGGLSASNPRDPGGRGGFGQIMIDYVGPDAGENQNLPCGMTNTTLIANAPSGTATTTWTLVSGTGVIASPNASTTNVTGLTPGVCAVFRWTWSGGAGCRVISDEITVCVDGTSDCNDEPCSAQTLPVNTSCVNAVYDNINSTTTQGVYEPGCGSFSAFDTWYKVTVPANGILTIEGVDNTPSTNAFYVGLALYSGPCNNLMHQGCSYTTSVLTPAIANYTGVPGEEIYVRVWSYTDNQSTFNLCAYTTTNIVGDIVPGGRDSVNTISCGTNYSFTDPGGNGNYLENQAGYYHICPNDTSQFVTVTFNTFDLDFGDQLVVMNGDWTHAPIIYDLRGSTVPPPITSSFEGGCLQFAFMSDNDFVSAGWDATVSCSPTPGTNNNSVFESKTNCNRYQDIIICADGYYDISNNGTMQVEEMSVQNRGCFDNVGEVGTQSAWFYFQVSTSGTLDFVFDGPNGQDYDFAIYGPDLTRQIPCPASTGDGPIRCSYSAAANPIGLGINPNTGQMATDFIEDASGDGWLAPLNVVAGETYSILFNIYQNGSPQPVIDLDINGTATIDCTPILLNASITNFKGINQGNNNLLSWVTESETNNDYFILERSTSGFGDWVEVDMIDGAGTSQHNLYYNYTDENPYHPISYYRLRQVAFDGSIRFSEVISISSGKELGDVFVSDIHPNPSSTYTSFYFNGIDTETPLNISVINELGAQVKNYTYNRLNPGSAITFDTSDLPNGMYFVSFRQGVVQKVQKLHILR